MERNGTRHILSQICELITGKLNSFGVSETEWRSLGRWQSAPKLGDTCDLAVFQCEKVYHLPTQSQFNVRLTRGGLGGVPNPRGPIPGGRGLRGRDENPNVTSKFSGLRPLGGQIRIQGWSGQAHM